MLVAITGVSGSGKSSLLHDVLYQGLAGAKTQTNGSAPPAILWDKIEGDEWLDDVILVDQSPIGRTPRSNPVTYIKAFDIIRELFAGLPESKKRAFSAGHFSFNVPGGRCENCQGDGTVTVEMQFLADVELICDECKGTRYKPQVLEIRYKGKNIHEVLNMTIREGLKFFADVPRLTDKLRGLDEVGLGYLRFGQSATTLSGGEAQRMKLAAHLQTGARASIHHSDGGSVMTRKRRVLYIFDEPTTGLHFDDVSKLLFAFRRLIDAGGSIIVIEHNLEVIKTADWVIDLGPEGGDRGGRLVGAGPPEAIAQLNNSYTGQYLKPLLNGGPEDAPTRISASIRAFAEHLGKADKYHETVTIAWMRLVQQAADCNTFQQVAASFPQFLDKFYLNEFYSAETLQSETARESFVEPDKKPLPSTAPSVVK